MSRIIALAFVLVFAAFGCGGAETSRPPPAAPPPAPAASVPPPPPPASLEETPPPAATSTSTTASRARSRFVIHIADVGTGLAAFIEGPDFALVYDAGSNDDLATGESNRFVAYLKWAKPQLARIDHVILSHPHRDHVELLADVLSTYDVKSVWDSGAVNSICGYRRFIDAVVHEDGVAYHTSAHDAGEHVVKFDKAECGLAASAKVPHAEKITEGTPVKLGESATMTFLHVDATRYPGDKFNANSLVTVLDLDGTRVLLMGDAEAGGREEPSNAPKANSVEGYVLTHYKAMIDADVLIAGHHGSKSSSRKDFIDAVSPKVSVISSGPKEYGSVVLPDDVIRKELARASQLLETDRDDTACAKSQHKIGSPADGKPGGCDNVQITIDGGKLQAEYVGPT